MRNDSEDLLVAPISPQVLTTLMTPDWCWLDGGGEVEGASSGVVVVGC